MPLLRKNRAALRRALLGFGVAAFALAGTGARAENLATTREYALKAAFLFHFTRFVAWPDSAFADSRQPFVIGVLGEDPFGETLDDIVANETVDRRRIEVRRWEHLPIDEACQILFVSRTSREEVSEIMSALEGRSILTVGDDEELPESGGVVGFAVRDNRIRLRINARAAESAGLVISSKLLRQAAAGGESR